MHKVPDDHDILCYLKWNEMEVLVELWVSVAAVLGGYIFLFVILRRLNDWNYAFTVGKKQHPLPPGDMGWPLFGNILPFMKAFRSGNPDSFIRALVSRHGKTGIYKTHLFGRPSIIVCGPDTCRRVLTDDQHFKAGYPRATKLLMGESFHDHSPAEHKRFHRLATAPIAGHSTLAMYMDRIEDIMISSLEEWASMNHPVELLKEMKAVMYKVIVQIFMGSDSQSIVAEIADLFGDLFQGLFTAAINIPGFPFHKALKAREKLDKILQSVVDERRMMIKSGQREQLRDLIDMLLEVSDENGEKLKDEEVVNWLVALLLAGHETSALGIVWSMIHLTDNPEFLKKAKEEQEEIIKRRPTSQKRLSLKEIKEMNYLAKVIDEMLRHSSVLFSIFREANADVNINGYIIPKGWRVLVWLRNVHMDPEYHQNPQEFNPSRWDDYNVKTGTLLPFGGGSRLCPGMDLAKLEMFIFLHYFLLNYKLERANPSCAVAYYPVPIPKDKCLARIVKIPSS